MVFGKHCRHKRKKWMLLLALGCMLTISASAWETYTINGTQTISIPEVYTWQGSLDRISGIDPGGFESDYLDQPSDLCLDTHGNIYIADTGNNRVIKCDGEGRLIKSYTEAGSLWLSSPQGVFVTRDDIIYIADTNNSRIVSLDQEGNLIQEFYKPDSSFLMDVDVYMPTKIAVSEKSGLYVQMGESVMNVDMDNQFRSFIGQTDVGYDFLDWFLRTFASDVQKKSISKRTAAPFFSFELSEDDLIYAVTDDTLEGQIKVINSVGNNIYRKLGTAAADSQLISDMTQKLFSGNVLSTPFSYGEKVEDRDPEFADICVDGQGIITVVEKQSGKLYQYDGEGNLLCVFGGLGERQGSFSIPSAITVDEDGTLYVLDSEKGCLQWFSPTPFLEAVHRAVALYGEGDYQESGEAWREVMKTADLYPLARQGLAKTAMKEENYLGAMEEYRLCNDRSGYAKAFGEYRYLWIQSHFGWTALIVIAALCALAAGIVALHKSSRRLIEGYQLRQIPRLGLGRSILMGFGTMLHPAKTMDCVQGGRKCHSLAASWLIIAAVFATRLLFLYTVAYPFQDVELRDINFMMEFIKLILPILTWTATTFLISSQFDGESTLGENFTAVAYCSTPYIVMNLLAILASHVLSYTEISEYALLVNGVTVWMVLLYVFALARINDFGAGKAIVVGLIALVAMLLIWFIVLFAYVLAGGVAGIVKDVLLELQLNWGH